jgi:hypothetical protein
MGLFKVSELCTLFTVTTFKMCFRLALGLNPYDVRKKCNRVTDGQLCYQELKWIEAYMNQPHVKLELGANENIEFQSCNEEVRGVDDVICKEHFDYAPLR